MTYIRGTTPRSGIAEEVTAAKKYAANISNIPAPILPLPVGARADSLCAQRIKK